MTFFDLIKKFLIYTLKEIYSFFLKLSLLLLFLIFFLFGITTFYYGKNNLDNAMKTNYSYVLFNVSDLPEDKNIDVFMDRFSNNDRYRINFFEILSALEDIKENEKIKGIIINLDDVSLSSTHTEEFIEKFKELKKNNKKIYGISSYIDNTNYSLASISDEVILLPTHSSGFSLGGYHYSNLYFKELLDKLGVNVEVVRIGKFKSFGENYNSTTISDGLREEMTRILDNKFEIFVNNISENRDINREDLTENILNGNLINISPFEARDKKFVDRLEYLEDFYSRNNISSDDVIDIYDYYMDNSQRIVKNLKPQDSEGTIAVIYAEGDIVFKEETSYTNIVQISPSNMEAKLEKLKNIDDLKGIVLRVNSPGGSALASEMIYQMLSKLKVPIYVSMGSTAASGGYYISMAGDKVFSNNSTITGSIGVVTMYPRFYNAQNKFGVKSNSISKGKYSDMYDSFLPLSEDAKDKIRNSMNNTYTEFKSRVVENRKIEMDKLEEYAQGRIWLGKEAKEIKLVDDNITFEKTLKILAEDLKLKEYSIENIYNENNMFDSLKTLGSYIATDIGIFQGLSKIYYKKEIMDELDFVMKHTDKPLYYLPNSFMY